MSKFLAVIGGAALCTSIQAETVLWKATGNLTTGTGVFLRQDLSPDDPVTIRITYDDQAIPQLRGSALGQLDSDYRTSINLRVILTSGSYTWEGFVESAATTIPTTFLTITNTFQSLERVQLDISSADNGTFPNFPFRLGESDSSLFLNFRANSRDFLGSGISAGDIHPAELSSATGKISTGVGNNLTFTIEPTSLEVLFEADETITPIAPVLTTSTNSENFILTWQSDFRFRYRVESTSDLSSDTWDEVETRFGTDAIITRIYPLTSSALFYRVVALERPLLN